MPESCPVRRPAGRRGSWSAVGAIQAKRPSGYTSVGCVQRTVNARAGPQRRHELEPPTRQVDVRVQGPVDLDHSVAPPNARVQAVHCRCDTLRCQLPGAEPQVGLDDVFDRRPQQLEHLVVVVTQGRRQILPSRHTAVREVEHPRRRRPVWEGRHVVPDHPVGRGHDDVEGVLQAVRPLRREEVGDVAVSGHQLQKVAHRCREADPAGRAESAEGARRLLDDLGTDRELAVRAGCSEPRSGNVVDTESQSNHACNHPSLRRRGRDRGTHRSAGAPPCQGVSAVAERLAVDRSSG